jgi:putative sigma-54 modulation protein
MGAADRQEDGPAMKITVTGHHVEMDDSLRAYATERIEKLGKYSANVVDARAVIEHARGAYRAEVILRADHHRFFGECSLPDARASIDSAVDKVEHQLQRFKEKVQRKHKHEIGPSGALAVPLADEEYEGEDFEFEYEELEPGEEPATE